MAQTTTNGDHCVTLTTGNFATHVQHEDISVHDEVRAKSGRFWYLIDGQFNQEQFDQLLAEGNQTKLEDYFLVMVSYPHENPLATIKYMVASGINPHCQNDAAFILSCSSTLDRVMFFVESHGANINAYNGNALISAIKARKMDIAHYLLQRGARMTAHSMYIAIRGCLRIKDILSLLQEADYELLAHVYFGRCIISREISSHLQMMKALRARGIDLNQYYDAAPNYVSDDDRSESDDE